MKVMERNELVKAAVAAGITKAHSMKSVVLEQMLSEMSITKETGKRGRPVDVNSVRQQRLTELEIKRQNGDLRRGRPVDTNSERQIRLNQQAINKELGIGQGRPVNLDSVRQKRLAEIEARRIANGGVIKRGRPAKLGDEIAG
jgi:hypothetical protein